MGDRRSYDGRFGQVQNLIQERAPTAELGIHSGREGRSLVEPLDYGAIDGEAGASELAAAGAGNQAVLDKCQDLKFFAQLASEALSDGVLSPFE